MMRATLLVIAICVSPSVVGSSDLAAEDAVALARGYARLLLQGDSDGIFRNWHPRFIEEIGGAQTALTSVARVYGLQNPQTRLKFEIRLSAPRQATFSDQGSRVPIFVVRYVTLTKGFPNDTVQESMLVLQPDSSSDTGQLRVFDVSCWTYDSLSSYFTDFEWSPDETANDAQVIVSRNRDLPAMDGPLEGDRGREIR